MSSWPMRRSLVSVPCDAPGGLTCAEIIRVGFSVNERVCEKIAYGTSNRLKLHFRKASNIFYKRKRLEEDRQ